MPPILSGVFAALLTPFDGAGALDAGVVRTLARYLLNEGLDGIAAAGTTGEFPSLARDEKDAVTRGSCEAAGDEGRVIAGVFAADPAERAWLAAQAPEHGAAAVFLTTPIGAPPPAETLLAWYRTVRHATGLPVFAYNIPQLTGYDLPLDTLEALTAEGAILGYKDSTADPARLTGVVKRFKGRLTIFAGSEDLFPMARDLGVDGFISGMANVFPRTVAAVWRGDHDADRRIIALKDVLRRHGTVPAMKYLLAKRGFAIGDPRLPLHPVPAAARADLDRLESEFGKTL